MFDKTKQFFRKWGVKLGILSELKKVSDHKKIEVDEEAYNRIMKNKEIYAGHVSEWHENIPYVNSNGESKTRNRMTMGMGKVLAQKMAGLIFNERVEINIDKEKASTFILDTLNDNGFRKHFQRYLEYGYALSGMAIKVYEYDGKIKLAYAAADAFYALGNDSETIDEALFVSEEYQNEMYYTLLEWNEWEGDIYVITNELYESSTKGKLGVKVPLDTIYEGLEPRTEIKNLRRPLFVYFKLNTANNKDLQSPLGVSIFENSYDTLFMLDYLYDFWFNEFKLGRRRIAVDRSMIKPFMGANGEPHMMFDTDETVFVGINADEKNQVKDLSVELRSADIISSINALLDILSMQTGLSSGTFTFDGKSVKTATEVVSENSMTYQTKNSHESLVEEGIRELITTIMDVAVACGLYTGETEFEVGVDFDDSIAQDRNQNLAYYTMAKNAGLIPTIEVIQRIFKLSEKEAAEWQEVIKSEQTNAVTDEVASLFGTNKSKQFGM